MSDLPISSFSLVVELFGLFPSTVSPQINSEVYVNNIVFRSALVTTTMMIGTVTPTRPQLIARSLAYCTNIL